MPFLFHLFHPSTCASQISYMAKPRNDNSSKGMIVLLISVIALASILVYFSTTISIKGPTEPLRSEEMLMGNDGKSIAITRLGMATRLCELELSLSLEYKDVVLESTVDDHSSRFEEQGNIFKVFIRGSMGDIYKPEEFVVACQVDLGGYTVASFLLSTIED